MATNTALALLESPPGFITKTTKRERELWLCKKKGWTDDQLAVRFKMTELAVKAAIGRHELWRAQFDNAEVDLEVNRLIIGQALPQAAKVLIDGMKATTTENVGRGKNVIMRKVADHATRLKSVEMMKTLMDTTRPRGGGIQFNQQINAAGGQQDGAVSGRGFDYETRLRQIRESKGISNDAGIPDADFEDVEQGGIAEELAKIGIEIPGEDKEDDEGEE
jgi:hypothetical protein